MEIYFKHDARKKNVGKVDLSMILATHLGKYHQSYANLEEIEGETSILYLLHEVSASIIENGVRITKTPFFPWE